MFFRKGTGAPWRERGGLVSRILPQEGDVPGVGRTATWVEVAPGSCRRLRNPRRRAPDPRHVTLLRQDARGQPAPLSPRRARPLSKEHRCSFSRLPLATSLSGDLSTINIDSRINP